MDSVVNLNIDFTVGKEKTEGTFDTNVTSEAPLLCRVTSPTAVMFKSGSDERVGTHDN